MLNWRSIRIWNRDSCGTLVVHSVGYDGALALEEHMAALERELGEFEARRNEFEAEYLGKWIVLRNTDLVGVFADFEAAAADAVTKFGRGPYLIRQVGAPPVVLPISVMQAWRDGTD